MIGSVTLPSAARVGSSSAERASVRAIIAGGHGLFRQALRHYLEVTAKVRVLAELSDGLQLLDMVERWQPHVLLVDAELPGVDLPVVILRAKQEMPQVRAIIFGVPTDEHIVVQLLGAGADACLVRDTPLAEVVSALREVCAGGTVLSPALTAIVVRELRRLMSVHGTTAVVRLTPRERQFLALVAAGMSNKEIAAALSLAESTVKNRLSLLFEKLGVRDRTQAAIYAVLHGLLNTAN